MKKTTIRIISFFIVLMMCITSISCTKKRDGDDLNGYSTRVKKTNIAEYGNFIYIRHSGKMYRFNRRTEKLSDACMNIECEGMCPVDCVMGEFVGASDGKMYFCGWQQYTHRTYLAYQDIMSGDTKIVKMLEDKEDPSEYYTYIEDGYWYYKRMVLKKGGAAENPEDYESYICRVSLDGKKDELFAKSSQSEYLKMVDSGKVITVQNNVIYMTDTKTKEKTKVYDLLENGYETISSEMSCIDGKAYFLVKLSQKYVNEEFNKKCMLFSLLYMDINTGEVKILVDEPVVDFCVTEDAVYYVPFKFRVPEGYTSDSTDKTYRMDDGTLYACDYDGKNIRKIFSDPSIEYAGMGFTVIDGFIYSWMNEVDPKTYQLGPLFIGGIEIATGRLIKTKKPEK